MKLLGIILIFLLSAPFITAQNVIGKWEDNKNIVNYEFRSDSSVVFEQSGYPVFINSFTLDETKSPIWIDFYMKMGEREIVIPGLLKMFSEDSIMIEQFTPFGEHPVKFTDDDTEGMRAQHILIRLE